MKETIKLVPGIDLVCGQLERTKKIFVTNLQSPQICVYTLKSVCRCTFQHLEANFINLRGMELATDLTLPFLSSVNNYLYFLLQVLAVSLNE